MITLTESARNQINSLLATRSQPDLALRVAIAGRRAGQFMYHLGFIGPDGRSADDIVVEDGDLAIVIDHDSAEQLKGSTMDFIELNGQTGFTVNNPNPVWTDSTEQAIQTLLDEEINPGLGMHGGLVSLVEVKDNVAYVAFGGGCQGCGLVDVTLKQGVEVRIKDAVPGIERVVDITDHGSGQNPYHE